MQPGVPLLELHGKIKQEKRTQVYFDFLQRPCAVLFATDIASRGLDFPSVDWVVQADAPEDKDMYIHRVGRTARYKSGGKSMLVCLPSEWDGMSTILKKAKLPVKKLSINPSKTVVVSQRASSIVASSPDLNSLAKKAFKSYLRSVQLMSNKEIFQVEKLPLNEFASSLGLASTPSVRFLNKLKSRLELRGAKNVNRKLETLKLKIKAEKLQKKMEKLSSVQTGITVEKRQKRDLSCLENIDKGTDTGGLFVMKGKKGSEINDEDDDLPDMNITKSRKPKKIRIEGSTSGENMRIKFNEDGEEESGLIQSSILASTKGESTTSYDLEGANKEYLLRIKSRLNKTKEQDRNEEKERVRDKHKHEKTKLNADLDDDGKEGGEMQVTLDMGSGDENSNSEDEQSESGYSSSDSTNVSNESDNDINLEEQENLALTLIREKKTII